MSAPVQPDNNQNGPVDAGFQPGPPAASLCGFTIPNITPFVNFRLPALPISIPLIPQIPVLSSFNCDASNPLDVAKGQPSGGGRKGYAPHNPDNDYDNLNNPS